MSTEDIVIASANAAAGTVRTAWFEKMTRHALVLAGREIAGHVQPTDPPGLFAPVDVERDGRECLGAILVLKDRSIIGWTVRLGTQNFETVIPHSAIESVEEGVRPGGALSRDRETLRIRAAGDTWTLVFANVFDGGRSIVPFLTGMMEGWLEMNFEAPSTSSEVGGDSVRRRAAATLLLSGSL